MKKTIKVENLRNIVNRILSVPIRTVSTGQKQVLCSLIEEVLYETGNYNGFQWINMTADQARDIDYQHPNFYNRRYL